MLEPCMLPRMGPVIVAPGAATWRWEPATSWVWVYVTSCTKTAVLGRSADSCQIIQQCLSLEFGYRCLIHPCQLHEAAVWALSGGGLEPKAFMWRCYFCSVYLVEHQWHFHALLQLKPSHAGCEAARRVPFQGTHSRKGWEALLQTHPCVIRFVPRAVEPCCWQDTAAAGLHYQLLSQIYTHRNSKNDKWGTENAVQHLAFLYSYISRLNHSLLRMEITDCERASKFSPFWISPLHWHNSLEPSPAPGGDVCSWLTCCSLPIPCIPVVPQACTAVPEQQHCPLCSSCAMSLPQTAERLWVQHAATLLPTAQQRATQLTLLQADLGPMYVILWDLYCWDGQSKAGRCCKTRTVPWEWKATWSHKNHPHVALCLQTRFSDSPVSTTGLQ